MKHFRLLLSLLFLSLLVVACHSSGVYVSSCYYDHYQTFYCESETIDDLALCQKLFSGLEQNSASIVCRGACGGNTNEVDITFTASSLVVNVSFYNGCFADAKCVSDSSTYSGTTISGNVLFDAWTDISHGNISYFWQATENICSQAGWFKPT